MKKDSKIYVAGHNGLVGSAIVRALSARGHRNIITKSRSELDLTNQHAVNEFFSIEKPSYVFIAAAKVGGILANSTYPAEFIYENIVIEANLIHASYINSIEKLLFLGSTCIYPKMAKQPIVEESLLTGPLEETNEWYAVAKIAGIKLCQAYANQYGCNFITAMPTNLYGPGDNFDLETSHVLPALLRKFHEARVGGITSVDIWGSGKPRREFLHVDDCADACLHLMASNFQDQLLNIGTGSDLCISKLAQIIQDIVGYKGKVHYDKSKPDGTPQKLTDISKIIKTGWYPKISLEEGVISTYQWYKENIT